MNKRRHKGPPGISQWLNEEFEYCDGASIAKEDLYNCYKSICRQMEQEANTPAVFGKILMSVFPRVRGRRLGQRGDTKYYYSGITVKETSKLCGHIAIHQKKRIKL
jgi:hypothetical protein